MDPPSPHAAPYLSPQKRQKPYTTIEQLFKKFESTWSHASCPAIQRPIKRQHTKSLESALIYASRFGQSERSKIEGTSAAYHRHRTTPKPLTSKNLPLCPSSATIEAIPLVDEHAMGAQQEHGTRVWSIRARGDDSGAFASFVACHRAFRTSYYGPNILSTS